MKRTPIQFYVTEEFKTRALKAADHFGGLSYLARKGFQKEIERAEREWNYSPEIQTISGKGVPIQFYIDAELKRRLELVRTYHGCISDMAYAGLVKEVERLEKLETFASAIEKAS